MKDALLKTLKKWFLNEQGEISLMKIGAEIVGIAGIVIMIPTLELVSIKVPTEVIDIAKIVCLFGGVTAAVGARNAMGKNSGSPQ
jgi:hypothetical protein